MDVSIWHDCLFHFGSKTLDLFQRNGLLVFAQILELVSGILRAKPDANVYQTFTKTQMFLYSKTLYRFTEPNNTLDLHEKSSMVSLGSLKWHGRLATFSFRHQDRHEDLLFIVRWGLCVMDWILHDPKLSTYTFRTDWPKAPGYSASLSIIFDA